MDLEEFDRLARSFDGVRRVRRDGRARWQLGGRLVARALDETHLVVRVPFDVRDILVHQHPDVFSVPARFARHMMVVADLSADSTPDSQVIEDAVRSAWQLQQQPSP